MDVHTESGAEANQSSEQSLPRSFLRSSLLVNAIRLIVGSILKNLGLLVALVGLTFTGVSVRENHYAQRAWLGAPVIKAFYVPQRKDLVGFEYTINNVGKLPPRGMYIGAALVSVGEGEEWRPIAESKCSEGRKRSRDRDGDFYRFSVIPGSPFQILDFGRGGSISTAINPRNAPRNVHIAGCIVYKIDTLVDRIRTTEFVAPLYIDGGYVAAPYVNAIAPN